jgi:MFS family permease
VRLRAAAGGCALAASAGWNIANVGAVATTVSHAYAVSLAVVGLFTTALFVTHTTVQIPGGRLCDRIGARVAGLAALTVTCAASAAALAWRDPAFAIGMRMLAGVGTGLAFVAGSDYVRSTAGSALAQGFYGAASMAAGGLALALVPQWGTWQAPFGSAALLAGAGIVVLAGAPADARRQPRPKARTSLFDRRLLPLAVMSLASFGASVLVGNWIVTLLERDGHDSHTVAGVAGALVLLLGIVTRPLGARVHDRRVLRASFIAGAVGTAALTVASPLGLVIPAAALVGLAAGVPFAATLTGATRARPDAPAAAVGFVNGAAALTVLVGTPLVGLTFSLPGGGRIGFAAIALLCVLGAAAVPSER